MLSKINTAVIHGIEAVHVVIETDITKGMPAMNVVGLADTTVKEARERIRGAMINSGCNYPMGRITVNMAPADMRKRGSHLDLPMAMGMAASSRQILCEELERYAFLGELSLDGSVNGVTGVLPMVRSMEKAGIKNVIVPYDNVKEAALVHGVRVYGAHDFTEILDHFNLERKIDAAGEEIIDQNRRDDGITQNYSDVKGQEYAKRALTIAAAGGHGILMTGSPSTGKTMLAERIPTIMPPMTYEEIINSTIIYSVAGLLSKETPYICKRPFRRPHHKTTAAGLIGGGTYPRPGEITLASGGVLFLDEFAEFDRNLIDTLRQPLETRNISITRAADTFTYPADFLLVAASNPCKCGYYGDPNHECRCSRHEIDAYRSKISGPIMDRIDIHLKLVPVRYEELTRGTNLSSEDMRQAVVNARSMQAERLRSTGFKLNSQMNISATGKYVVLDGESKRLLEQAYDTLNLNPRTLLKVKKVARTIADIDGSETVGVQHVAEALQYREQGANE